MKKLLVLTSIVLGFAVSAYAKEIQSCFASSDYTLKSNEGKTMQFHNTMACIAGRYVFLSGEKDPKIVGVTNKGCDCSRDNRIITMKD